MNGELIYENTAVLKSNAYLTPVTTAIEKYQFGGHEEEDEDEDDDDAGEEKEEDNADEEEEEEEEEQKDSEGAAVPFPPLDLNSSSSDRVERSSSKLWGVRSNGGANGLLGPQVIISLTIDKLNHFIFKLILSFFSPQVIRTSNPTEDKIAKEIRWLNQNNDSN